MTCPVPSRHLLSLPLELRLRIYSHLLPRENCSHPLPGVGITSVSHRPPTLALLTVHRQLTAELLDYFYAITTWKLIFSHAFNFFRVDPELERLEQSISLRQLRRVEVVFYCDILLLREYPSFGLDQFCSEIRRRAERACHVLLAAPRLHTVTVSWIDTTCTGAWPEKAQILLPLRRLRRDGMTIRVGEVSGPDHLGRDVFAQALARVLGEDRLLASSPSHAASEPARLRMLAFDVRQDRLLYQSVGGAATKQRLLYRPRSQPSAGIIRHD